MSGATADKFGTRWALVCKGSVEATTRQPCRHLLPGGVNSVRLLPRLLRAGEIQVDGQELRRTVLEVIEELGESDKFHLQSGSVLQKSAERLGIRGNFEEEQALLTFFGDLFRIGYMAWGCNLANASPPFCHITDRGRQSLARRSRDPANPDGYLAHLHRVGSLNPVAESYIREALSTFGSGCPKATAVMVGAAAESIILAIRDALTTRLDALSESTPKKLTDWRVKPILDAIESLLTAQKKNMPSDLFAAFESYWPAFTQQIRVARNAAGHPTSIDPVEEDTVQASLLIFPELVKLATELETWITKNYTQRVNR